MKVFTTGQIAKVCSVNTRTVSKWFDSGRLKGYRIPGSKDRRVTLPVLVKFLKEHGMPLDDLEDEITTKALIVTEDELVANNIKHALTADESFEVSTASGGFEAGVQAQTFQPDAIIVDFSIGTSKALDICKNLKQTEKCGKVIVIALLASDEKSVIFDSDSVNEVFRKPFDIDLLVGSIKSLVDGKEKTADAAARQPRKKTRVDETRVAETTSQEFQLGSWTSTSSCPTSLPTADTLWQHFSVSFL